MVTEKKKYFSNKTIKNVSLIAFIGLMLLLLIGLPLYVDVDNYQVSMVTSGMLGQDNFCQYISWILNRAIAMLNHTVQSVDWFAFFCRVSTIAAIAALGAAINQICKKWYWLVGYAVVFVVAFPYVLSQNYTLVTAFVMGAGLFLLTLSLWGKLVGNSWMICGTMLVIFALINRLNAAILFLPFLALEIVHFVYCKRRLKPLKKLLPVILCLCVVFVSDNVVRSSDKYAQAIRYDDARIAILDYPVKPYEEIKEQVPGLSENDYNTILSWQLLDLDNIDVDLFEQIAESGKTTLSVKTALQRIWNELIATPQLSILTFVMIAWALLCADWIGKTKVACAVGGAGIIALYFAIKGRFIDRICIPLLFCVIFTAALTIKINQGKKNVWLKNIFSALVLIIFISQLTALPFSTWDLQLSINAKQGVEDIVPETNENDVFIRPTWSYYSAQGRMSEGKLPTKQFLNQNLTMGDWSYGQVCFYQHLAEMGLNNPMRDLLERPNTYMMDGNVDRTLTYLREHYDPNIQAEKIGEKEGIPVWQFQIAQ